MAETDFEEIFDRLRDILLAHTDGCVIVRDRPGDVYADTRHIMKNGKPLFFGSVITRRNYVSFHLMPIYVYPELLADIPPSLEKRRHGKSCFNINRCDDSLFEALAHLTARGAKKYRAAGYLEV